MNPHRPNPSSRLRGVGRPWHPSLALGLLGSIVGCSSPADPDPDPHVTLAVEQAIEEQGVFSPVLIRVTALDEGGNPVPDVEVRWSARDGLVGEWYMGNRDRDWEQGPEAVRVTGEDGTSRVDWMLGPDLGKHAVEVSAPGAAPIELLANALPGVVLVGVWRLPEEAQEKLPSDTIRLHATNYYDWALPETLAAFEEGGDLAILGDVVRGSGVDSTWVFHLHPASIRTLRPPVYTTGQCVSRPPLSEEELDQALGSLVSRRLCTPLMLVAIEEP
jgi:hypothetical protein